MDNVIIIGGSMSGLLAAAALSRVARRVTVVDRDTLPARDAHRKGSAQSHHAHGLLARGREVMEDLLPGLTGELVARGAMAGDLQSVSRWISNGHRLAPAVTGLTGLLVSRPMLEGQVRRRVKSVYGVAVEDNLSVQHLTTHDGRITGVRLADGRDMHADLVVDASGRGSRAPTWLMDLGFAPPYEERVTVDLRYATREFRRRPGDLGGDLVIITTPTPRTPRAGVALAVEGDRWVVTQGGYCGATPPLDLPGFVAHAATLAAPDLHELLVTAEPIGEPRAYHTPASVRRRYERLTDLPTGLIVMGDAVCAFNPMYGQGMTVAATEAAALLEWARAGGGRPQAFYKKISGLIDAPWDIVVGGDLRLPGVEGEVTPRIRMVNAYLERFHAAAAHDPELGRRFLRVANLMDPPPALLSPSTLVRVLRNAGQRAEPALV
ncbi:FAD-dependent oxidoreductase [Nonomuraea sp. NPDC050556]|uniref:FAD-dependent oxidoreductase n=1 Tax=Nonomuraea sp. NPDC050556 TaxID=3364369 RepID=UPI0037BCA548